ncbi:hypothetical protein LTR84_008685 [Exophiala bonariae]|uniref:Uncharacterized protein n=1 Tax=Exophiala bonariae TaxID=1690606 RepID=A0AAV9MZT2_9EURO|nr:hypothetical protein LTR84_008685 [Exophiala bonariae]
MYSSKEICQLNPPRNLQPSDWVIELPQHAVQSGTPLAIARQQYQTVRLDRLIGYIENRFHKGCCFYEFLDENKDQDSLPGQTLVTNLFAYHEIEHWPGAKAHVKWTEFVMENLEYDAQAEAQASEQGLTLPPLPLEAVPIFRAMQLSEGPKLARKAIRLRTSIQELTAYKFERVGQNVHTRTPSDVPQPDEGPNSKRPRLAVLCEPDHGISSSQPEGISGHSIDTQKQGVLSEGEPLEPQAAAQTPSAPLPPTSRPGIFLDVLLPHFGIQTRLESQYLAAACCRPEVFQRIATGHGKWTTHTVKNLHRLMLRIIFSHQESTSKSFDVCYALARQKIHGFAERAFLMWQQANPSVPFDGQKDFPNWLTKMWEYIFTTIRHTHSIPADMSPDRAAVISKHQHLIAMSRQQRILRSWSTQLSARAAQHGQVRFRAEKNWLLDLWTGKVVGQPHPETGETTDPTLSPSARHMLALTAAPTSTLPPPDGGTVQVDTTQGIATVISSDQQSGLNGDS